MARKGKYHTHVEPYLEDIKKLRREGYREIDICKRLNVGKSSFSEYKKKYPELLEALKGSNLDLVENIKASMYQMAMGGYKKTKTTYRYYNGKKYIDRIDEEIMPPNSTAIAMSLKILDPKSREALSTNVITDSTDYQENQETLLNKIKEAKARDE
jgi:hypothetical protein